VSFVVQRTELRSIAVELLVVVLRESLCVRACVRVAKSGRGRSERALQNRACESKLRVLKIKARVAEQKERRTKKKGSVESAHLPDFFKVGAYVAHRRHRDC